MADKTKIEWTEATWNPIRGCSVVSEGCRNCYAMQVAARFAGEGMAYEGLAYRNSSGAHWTGKVKLIEQHLEDPLRWQRPRRIFVNSMSDLFHESIETDWITRIFNVMLDAPRHTFQVLTKRPGRMLEYCTRRARNMPIAPNVWLGVSCEDQKTADERIPLLMQTPAAVRWVSAEPLLGPIDLFESLKATRKQDQPCCWRMHGPRLSCACRCHHLDWLVVGGESGPGARPMHPEWARSLRDQCTRAGVPFFFKQWGEYADTWTDHSVMVDRGDDTRRLMTRVGKKAAGRTLDGRTWSEYPKGAKQ